MNKTRPVYLNLMQFSFPPMAIISICHRISGILIFLFLPMLLWLLSHSLVNQTNFQMLQIKLHSAGFKFLIWAMASVTLFHLLAGIRHLLMDMGIGESLSAGKTTAYLVFAVSAILIILMGFWLW